jgi:phage shock protein A
MTASPQAPAAPSQGATQTATQAGDAATQRRVPIYVPPRQQAQLSPSQGGPSDDAPQSAEAIAERKKLLDAMEVESDHLSSRAASVESSLDTLEQQMHQSGLGLRGDMVSARSNMRSDLSKAKEALDGQDTDRARKYIDQASREIEKLEAFLGR